MRRMQPPKGLKPSLCVLRVHNACVLALDMFRFILPDLPILMPILWSSATEACVVLPGVAALWDHFVFLYVIAWLALPCTVRGRRCWDMLNLLETTSILGLD